MRLKLLIILNILTISCISPLKTEPVRKTPVLKAAGKPAEILPIKVAKPEFQKRAFKKVENTKSVKKYCSKISKKFIHWGWGRSKCDSFKWNHVRDSFLGDPLMWVTFGNEKEHKENPKNLTLVMCGVHGDEITPVKFCFDILHYLHHLEINQDENKNFKDNMVVVAPIANPDSFFKKYPTRTNARGIDINRNFPTRDWHARAINTWKKRYRSDKRRNPGTKPNSENETVFQVNLIKRYNPTRIISVHAPLTILDYDGPEVHQHADLSGVAHHANHILVQMSKKAKGYRIKNYPFFPGSLGNYAGNERGIPTYTLELPSSDNRKHREYWKKFKSSIDYALFNKPRQKDKLVLSGDVAPKKVDAQKN